MPVWVAPAQDNAGFSRTGIQRALAHGLTFRPLADTARHTLDWFEELDAEVQARVGGPLTAERESAVLRAWHDAG
jgi:2'-hydroxyisoflavone reductase